MPTAPRNVFMFVMRMTPPTVVPRMRAGRMRTMYAATGAAMTPPIRSAPTTVQGIWAKVRAKRKPMLALRATRNSLVSHSTEKPPYRTRYRKRPDFRPVHVLELPVRDTGCRCRAYLGNVHARRRKSRRNADRQQQTLRSHPVSHAKRPVDQLRNESHNRQQQEISHLPQSATLHLVYHFYVKYVAHNIALKGLCRGSGRRSCPNLLRKIFESLKIST